MARIRRSVGYEAQQQTERVQTSTHATEDKHRTSHARGTYDNQGRFVKGPYDERKQYMTMDERRRECELKLLSKCAKLPRFAGYHDLFSRRLDPNASYKTQYMHDIARRKAVWHLLQERVKDGLEYQSDADNFRLRAIKISRESWYAEEEITTRWIVAELEEKLDPKYQGFKRTLQGRAAVYRDLLHCTITPQNRGGIPAHVEPWLRDSSGTH